MISLIYYSFKSGDTPLLIASRAGRIDIVSRLLDKGVGVNIPDRVRTSSWLISELMIPPSV